MKTLYLHIGMPKTGTSSIQKFLLHNRKVLNEYGYCFPKFPYKYPYVYNNRNGYFLVGKCYNPDRSRNLPLEQRRFSESLSHVLECFQKYDHVILTEETLWRCLHTRSQIATTLKAHADAHGYCVKVIVYLRRQDEFQISIWKQNVKHAKTASTKTFDERLEEVLENERYLFEYAARLDELAEVFGHDNLIVRRFEPDSWVNDSLIDDFLYCVGLEHTDDFSDLPKDSNPSLSENMAYMKCIINSDPSFSKKELSYLGHRMRDLSAESSANYPCSLLSASETRALLEQFADENARVARDYCQDGRPMFSDKIKDVPKWQPDNPYMQEDMIRFFSSAIIDLHRENEALRRELTNLQHTVENEQNLFRMFKQKLKHPLRALIHRLFPQKKEDQTL